MKGTTSYSVFLLATLLGVMMFLLGCENLATETEDAGDISTMEFSATTTTAAQAATEETTTTLANDASTTTVTSVSANDDPQSDPGESSPNDPDLSSEPFRCEENSWFLQYEGIWTQWDDPAASGEAMRVSIDPTCSLTLYFKGTGMRLITLLEPGAGTMIARLEGYGMSRSEPIDLRSADKKYQQEVWYSGELPYGEYMVSFKANTATFHPGSQYWVDAIEVWGACGIPQASGEIYYPSM